MSKNDGQLESEPDQEDDPSLRISELIEIAGVSRDMIKYYLRAQLLPPALKPRANLSLYSTNHVALIGLIRKFQEQTKLSLPDIAELFRSANYDPNSIELELLWARHNVGDEETVVPLAQKADASGGPTVPDDFLRQLGEAKLLPPSSLHDEVEQRQAALLWAAHEAGVPIGFFQAAREKLAELADIEVKALISIKRRDNSFSEIVEHVTTVDRMVNRWIIAEKNRQIRHQFQQVIDNSERAISTLLNNIYRPSDLFRQRYQVDEALLSLTAREHTLEATEVRQLSQACVLLGEFDIAISLAESTLEKEAEVELSQAAIALAEGIRGNVERAYEYSAKLENGNSRHPEILQARILALLLRASKLRGVADTNELMGRAAQLFLELPLQTSPDQVETILLLARANVAFPDFANSRGEAMEALQALLVHIDTDAIEVAVPALKDCLKMVYRIYVLYYLGILHQMSDNPSAAKHCFEQVVQTDPASNFGEKAYLALGNN